MSTQGISAPWGWGGGGGGAITPVCHISSAGLTLHFPDHTFTYVCIQLHNYTWGLTYVVFMVDDRVEGHVFAPQVSLSRLHIVGAMVALNEALKLTIHNGAMS